MQQAEEYSTTWHGALNANALLCLIQKHEKIAIKIIPILPKIIKNVFSDL